MVILTGLTYGKKEKKTQVIPQIRSRLQIQSCLGRVES
jgi:hypothetical protein